jgi:hypothetical protein
MKTTMRSNHFRTNNVFEAPFKQNTVTDEVPLIMFLNDTISQ